MLRSTIVEITQALQPSLARTIRLFQSTIVEITQALQPGVPNTQTFIIYNSRNYLGIIARNCKTIRRLIYNSRNYLGIIAQSRSRSQPTSTIVEITQALQPCHHSGSDQLLSTIVEITQALQPRFLAKRILPHLQQQKLLRHYSLRPAGENSKEIYNSRNYLGIIAVGCVCHVLLYLQQQKLLRHYSHVKIVLGNILSTIVEITQALQPWYR